MINGNAVGGTAPIKTVKIVDENGTEILGIVVDQETIFTATDDDVREGYVYASDNGISVGTKVIPNYHTRWGYKLVAAGKDVTISIPEYDYTYLLVSISVYDTNREQSVKTTHTSIDDGMYGVGDNAKLSDIIIDHDNEKIVLGITVAEKSIVRYLVTREEF